MGSTEGQETMGKMDPTEEWRSGHMCPCYSGPEKTRLAKCIDLADRECPSLDRFVSAQTKQGDSEGRVLRPRGR